jgi:hypothetical protein
VAAMDFLAPPSGLPAISPSRGEIGSFGPVANFAVPAIGESRHDMTSPPLRGRWPAGQRGVMEHALLARYATCR